MDADTPTTIPVDPDLVDVCREIYAAVMWDSKYVPARLIEECDGDLGGAFHLAVTHTRSNSLDAIQNSRYFGGQNPDGRTYGFGIFVVDDEPGFDINLTLEQIFQIVDGTLTEIPITFFEEGISSD